MGADQSVVVLSEESHSITSSHNNSSLLTTRKKRDYTQRIPTICNINIRRLFPAGEPTTLVVPSAQLFVCMDELQLVQGQKLLKFLTTGSNLTKITAVNKNYKRYFYYDPERKYLYYKGSQKKPGSNPRYDLRDMVDIRKGYASDIFNKLIGTYEEKCCFSIVFSTTPRPLNLVAATEQECDNWVKGLRLVRSTHREVQKTEDERVWITDYFHSVDTNEDGRLDFQEIRVLLQRMSVKMSKKEALAKFTVSTVRSKVKQTFDSCADSGID